MKKLNKYLLKHETAWHFLIKNLDNLNALSKEILKIIDFEKGIFFTLLSSDANLDRLYKFEEGGILPQNPEKKIKVMGKNYIGCQIPSIDEELAQLLINKIQKKSIMSIMFDDVIRSKFDKNDLYKSCGVFFDNEIYYLLNNRNITLENLKICLIQSNAFWHSLCVLTKSDCKEIKNQTLSLNQIIEICKNAQFIILGAYDGEGYVFWEKEGLNFFED